MLELLQNAVQCLPGYSVDIASVKVENNKEVLIKMMINFFFYNNRKTLKHCMYVCRLHFMCRIVLVHLSAGATYTNIVVIRRRKNCVQLLTLPALKS